MFEQILATLPEAVRATRMLYEPETGGYHLPRRDLQQTFGLADVARMRAEHVALQYDCIETPVADLLSSLVVNTRSRLILETGTSRGFSTSHLAAAARCVHGAAARVVTLDVEHVPHRFFCDTEITATIEHRLENSLDQDPRALGQGEDFDFLFLDSLHSYDHLGREVALYLPHLKLGGLMALHDTFYYDGLGLLALALMQVPGLEALSFPTHRQHAAGKRCPGVSLFRKVAAIEPGSLCFPAQLDLLRTELVIVKSPEVVVAHLGMAATRAPYEASRLRQSGPRIHASPALLEPAGARPKAVPSPVPAPPKPLLVPAAPPGAIGDLRRQAMLAHATGQIDRAIDLLQQALVQSPMNHEVLCDLASMALASGDPVAAVKLARSALDRAPDHAISLYTLGMALAQGGAHASAIRTLQYVASGPGAEALRADAAALADQVAPMLERLRQLQPA